jgi:hypothetical protein
MDGGGLLFSEGSQGLYVLNATAAFIWCCLEDGLNRDQTVTSAVRAYNVPAATIEREMGALLRQWERQGLLASTERDSDGNGPGRDQEGSDAAECPYDGLVPSYSVRHYRLLSTAFRLRYATPMQDHAVHPVLAHLETPPSKSAQPTALDVVWNGEQHLLILDGCCKHRCSQINELAPLVKYTLLVEAINSYHYLLYIHAGVVRGPRGCILLPAAAGSGKTSLTAAMIRAGFFYLSDEVALLEKGTLWVRPVPVSLCVKDGAWDLLSSRYPELRHRMVHHRRDSKLVRYLNPPPAAMDPEPGRSYPVRWIVFPSYMPRVQTALRPLSHVDALRRLLEQCLAMPELLDQTKVEDLVRWIESTQCFELPMSSLDEAVALLRTYCTDNTLRLRS